MRVSSNIFGGMLHDTTLIFAERFESADFWNHIDLLQRSLFLSQEMSFDTANRANPVSSDIA